MRIVILWIYSRQHYQKINYDVQIKIFPTTVPQKKYIKRKDVHFNRKVANILYA